MNPKSAVWLAATTALLAIIALIVVLVVQPFTPQVAADSAPPTTVPVVVQPYDGAQNVTINAQFGSAPEITLPATGTVTALECSPGDVLESGTSPVAVNGQGILALHGATPYWRDVSVGAAGADVSALQQELARLGHDVSADGDRFGQATITALRAILTAAGLGPQDSLATGALTRIMWLPTPTVSLASCATNLGSSVQQGEAFAATAATIESVTFSSAPAASADATLTVDDVTVPVAGDGTLAAESLGDLAATPQFVAASADPAATIRGTLQFAAPVDAASLPPQAIATTDGIHGCVTGDGSPVSVTLLTSELGQTYVLFSGDAPGEVSLTPPAESECE